MHYIEPEKLPDAETRMAMPWARSVCGRVPTFRDLTTATNLVTCPFCLEWLRAKAPPAVEWITNEQTAQRLGISSDVLATMLVRAPANLPGAPTIVGDGRKRKHRRWNAAMLDEWMAAFRDFELTQSTRPATRPKRAQKAATNEAMADGAVDWKDVGRVSRRSS